MLKENLATLSPKDKPWNIHKAENKEVLKIYAEYTAHAKKAERMYGCSGFLDFGEIGDPDTGEISYKLLKAQFCRVRYCPICQWRRSLLWHAKFYQALPEIIAAYPTSRFIFLTLTVKNCKITELRETLQIMNKAWRRFVLRKEFANVQGWVRTTEVTREKDDKKTGRKARPEYAHPHFHCLLMVPASYFSGQKYVNQAEWTRVWKESMRLDYEPQVDVRVVKKKKTGNDSDELPFDGLTETLKYSVKPSDMTADKAWFIEMTEQTHKLRFIATGGLFKNVLKPEDKITNEDMIQISDDKDVDMNLVRYIIRFLWEDKASGYFLEQVRLPSLEDRFLYRLSKPDG